MSAQTSLPHRFVERAPALITANAVVWWMCYVLSRNNLDPYGDMVEAYSWGINWVWGYDKHPPLSGWVAAAWFSVFPTQDWAFYLLAVAMVGRGTRGCSHHGRMKVGVRVYH